MNIRFFATVALIVCFRFLCDAQVPSQYSKGIRKGDTGAMYNMASYYYNSPDKSHKTEALKLYEKAAAKGHVESMYMAAYMYYYGIGQDSDVFCSVTYAKEAYDKGYAPAAWILAEMMKNGDLSWKVDDYRNYLSAAADAGLPVAQCELGIEYLYGDHKMNITKNTETGASWLKKASENNDVRASYYLGMCYENGWGVSRINSEKAFELFKCGAAHGYVPAQEKLAQCYWEGTGTSVDKQLAISYFESASGESITAQYELGRIFYEDKEFNDFQKARELLQGVIEGKNFDSVLDNQKKGLAYHYLAAIYRYGRNVTVDEQQALDYEKLAASYGNADARIVIEMYQED